MLALGYGSMFNHSSKIPNVDYRFDKENAIMHYYAGKHIEAREELFIFYRNKLWFVNKNDDEEEGDSTINDMAFYFAYAYNSTKYLSTSFFDVYQMPYVSYALHNNFVFKAVLCHDGLL